jgi:hypothetical protein
VVVAGRIGQARRVDDAWPALPTDAWAPTRETLHLWTQVVGKTRLGLTPLVNHWWNVPLYVNAVGLTTSLMPLPDGGLEVTFDLHDHVLWLRRTDGRSRRLRLEPRTVADFHAEYLALLTELDVAVDLNPMPAEIPGAVPFDRDRHHASYDAEAVETFWRTLVSAHRVLSRFRAEFRGKASPVHFFWGAFDLAVTRFSGRPAPVHPGGVPHCPDWVMVEAYDSEVSSCGYWPGGSEEGSFYAYAYPEPAGFRDLGATDGSRYDEALGEHLLPWADVRRAADPEELVLAFLRRVHEAAARDWPAS